MSALRFTARARLRHTAEPLAHYQTRWGACLFYMDRKPLAETLATAALAGPLACDGLVERWTGVFGKSRRWLRPLASRLVERFGESSRPRRFHIVRFLLVDEGFSTAAGRESWQPIVSSKPKMCPAGETARTWKVPRILTPGDLARWLDLPFDQLAWFADLRTLERLTPEGPLRHYRYRWLTKRDGTARLIEVPKPRLKAMQRRILAEILDRIPPHRAAHGFRAAHSIRTFVAPHVGRALVLRLDLRDFFPSIWRARVMAIFLTAGYPEPVAELLAGFCTNTTPRPVLDEAPVTNAEMRRRVRLLYARPHLPQGAPTSPALANLAAWRLDCRLAGLAHSVAANYTRYADDLVFSGETDFARNAHRLAIHVGAIAIEEGFEVHWHKLRAMRRGVAQHAAGLVLNDCVNIPRGDFDRLKAILHNCARHGPASQNRAKYPDFRAHLAGRLAHLEMIAPARARKLRADFERITW